MNISNGKIAGAALAGLVVLAGGEICAQQAPMGIPPVNLTQPFYSFDTGEAHGVKVVVLARGLRDPIAVALLPSGDALIAERQGNLRLVQGVTGISPKLDPKPIEGLPKKPDYHNSGLQDVALHPQFSTNHLVYFTFNQAGNTPQPDATPPVAQLSRITLFRGRLEGHELTQVQALFTGDPGSTNFSRLAFDDKGFVYMTTGTSGGPEDNTAQRLNSVYGKVLRLRDDGTVPADNPFVRNKEARPEIYSYGHRDHLGLTFGPNGQLFNAEHGPNGGDEINVILPGRNYGWPKVSFGRAYPGPRISESPVAEGIESPLVVWLPSIAPGGVVFYTGGRFPAWKGNLFIASARRGEIPGTGGLERVVFNDKLEEIRRESLFLDLHQRFRDVRQGPDGLLYAVTQGAQGYGPTSGTNDGTLLRIEPEKMPTR